jgi:PhzF family phenazine biosynthesis protein
MILVRLERSPIIRAPITTVDAFADRPFTGNPAGVCILSEPAPESWMQSVAAEMNLSETAFLVPQADGYQLRWFAPAVEIALCGHATLASAHVLWETGQLPRDATARFHTKSGLLTAVRAGELIELDFPAQPPAKSDPPAELLSALGVTAEFVGRSKFDYFVVLASAQAVRDVKPDFAKIATLPVRGIIVTAKSDEPKFDFVSRFFCPAVGVNEDPATGSAHCCLAPYWTERLGKAELVGHQLSKRTAIIRVRCVGERVKLGGKAITIVRGEISA